MSRALCNVLLIATCCTSLVLASWIFRLSTALSKPGPNWNQAFRGGLEELPRRLRSEGVPDHWIRPIITAIVSEHYDPDFTMVKDPPSTFEYWRPDYGMAVATRHPDRQALNQKLAAEISQTVPNDLQGDRRLIAQTLHHWLGEVNSTTEPVLERLDAWKNQNRQELVNWAIANEPAILRDLPEPYRATYLTRASGFARTLRSDLKWFEPNEQEYLAFFSASREPLRNTAEARQRISSSLGPERFEEYLYAQDATFIFLRKLTLRTGANRHAAIAGFIVLNGIVNDRDRTNYSLRELRINAPLNLRAALGDATYNLLVQCDPNWLERILDVHNQAP